MGRAKPSDAKTDSPTGRVSAMLAISPHNKAIIKAVGNALLISVALILAFEWVTASRELALAKRDMAAGRVADSKLAAALKFFELQTTTGVADYGTAPQGIMPKDPEIAALARGLKTPDNAFDFVTHRIGYSRTTTLADTRAGEVLDNKVGNCQGKANLLASLFLAQGADARNIRVVYGHVRKDGMPSTHAWLEVMRDDRWWVLDTTPYLDAGAGIYDRDQYYSQNSVVPVVVYNQNGVGFGPE